MIDFVSQMFPDSSIKNRLVLIVFTYKNEKLLCPSKSWVKNYSAQFILLAVDKKNLLRNLFTEMSNHSVPHWMKVSIFLTTTIKPVTKCKIDNNLSHAAKRVWLLNRREMIINIVFFLFLSHTIIVQMNKILFLLAG